MALPEWAKPLPKHAKPLVGSTPAMPTHAKPIEKTWRHKVAEFARPTLEFGGMLAGGTAATIPGVFTGPAAPLATAAGGTLGYAGGAQAADIVDAALGVQSRPQKTTGNALLDETKQVAGDIATGAQMEALGPIVGKGIQYTAQGVGKVAKPVLGRLSGTGTPTVKQALKAGKTEGFTGKQTDFTKAMRGNITGEEIVSNAKSALAGMKQARGDAYRSQLAEIKDVNSMLDLTPIKAKTNKIFSKFMRIGKDGKPMWDRTKISKQHVGPIKDLYDDIMEWGSRQGDATPLGVDMLKSNIDDLYSESNSGRALIAQLRKMVKNELVDQVPQYAKLTKPYEEATKLIKDIEMGLSMRKQGMSGRVVADQTLRRLMSSMKDNFELRGELLKALSKHGGADLEGQLGGHLASEVLPQGLSATGIGVAASAATYLNPKMAPLVAAASPRVQNEFMRYFGKALGEMQGTAPTVGRAISYGAKKVQEKADEENNDPLGIR